MKSRFLLALRVAIGLVGLAMTACAGSPGAFGPDGFHHAELPVVVHYAEPGKYAFVGTDWRIDNFVVFDDGAIGRAKTAEPYVQDRKIDVRGDGSSETQRDVFVYDLKLLNRVTEAELWLQTIPIPMRDKDLSLEAMLDNFVESLSGTGLYRVSGSVSKPEARARTYAARVVRATPGKLGRFESIDATIELVNLDQLKVDPNAKSGIGRVIFVRTDYPVVIPKNGGYDSVVGRAVIVFGCDSHPRDFDATSADFDKFVMASELGPARP